jgi:pimeloyl-ACP methyl ester carboxylesterase
VDKDDYLYKQLQNHIENRNMKYLVFLLKGILSLPILLFAIATFLGSAYLQTLSLLLILVFIFYWPFFKKKKAVHITTRLLAIFLILSLQFTLFRGAPKASIYLSEEAKHDLHSIYVVKKNDWPDGTEDIYLETQYGKVHVLAYGNDTLPPLLMFHAASMGAHSWAENLSPLLGKYRMYAVDNIGEGNLSELKDPLVYPNSPKEIADFYASIAEELGIESCPVFGASNGGFIAQVYTYYYPEKVESLALFGPMGLTPLSSKSIFMLSAASMYPLEFVRNNVVRWAFGNDPYCHQKYGDWFDSIMKGTIPSVAKPVPMTTEQKQSMDLPISLFLGTSDPIVGDAEMARRAAEMYPDIQIEVLESGHLISVEHRDYINKKITEFLD